MPRLLDLFAGRFGWSKAFAARGWECVGVDLVEPEEIPRGCQFWKRNVMSIDSLELIDACGTRYFDFICASSPCEQFCEASGLPYIMENVRAAQQFVGQAVNHCGPFYLWGSGVPAILPQGINKGMTRKALGQREYKGLPGWNTKNEKAGHRGTPEESAGLAATIPAEISNCVADYAERLLEQKSGLLCR